MASIENRTGYYNVVFRFGGKKFTRSLKTTDENEAEGRRVRLEETIRFVESGRLKIPEGMDTATFLLSDERLAQKPVATATITLASLFQQFFESIPEGNLEDTTLQGMRRHRKHLLRIIGASFPVQQITTDDLQSYVTTRSKEKGSRGTVGGTTINKELVTFRTAWGWAVDTGKLTGVFPKKGIRLPKAKEMPPFQTWKEIERKIPNATPDEQAELWECLYLTMAEIKELLAYVQERAAFPFIYPMFCFAAYTGARRSELIRSQVSDIDFQNKVITIREKKIVRGKLSTRRVPLSKPLETAMKKWLAINPSQHTFCHTSTVIERSRKSSARTDGLIPLTADEASHHFKQPLSGSKWQVVHGWHCLRHSFISNCASKGIDQRMLDEWVERHTTEQMRRRYRHLFPSAQQDAMKLLFR